MLNARDVWNEQENRKERRMAAMRPVLAQLFAQIKKQSIHDPSSPYIVFEIPGYVFGYPIYQLKEAREYLTKTLTDQGFLVWAVEEKYLVVSWMKQNTQRPTNRPPLLTTMYRPQVYDPSALNQMFKQ
jgi:hypothetical protein